MTIRRAKRILIDKYEIFINLKIVFTRNLKIKFLI